MKEKEYRKLLEKINKLAYSINSLTQYVYDSEYGKLRYGFELEEKKILFKTLLGEIESILTVDSKKFINEFMKNLNDDTYELVHIELGSDIIHVAKPKSLNIDSGTTLIENEDVYIIGVNDSKVLSNPMVRVDNGLLPTISILTKPYSDIYFKDVSKHHKKYVKFASFVSKIEEELVKNYSKKVK